jgi:hypothetical protein
MPNPAPPDYLTIPSWTYHYENTDSELGVIVGRAYHSDSGYHERCYMLAVWQKNKTGAAAEGFSWIGLKAGDGPAGDYVIGCSQTATPSPVYGWKGYAQGFRSNYGLYFSEPRVNWTARPDNAPQAWPYQQPGAFDDVLTFTVAGAA